MASAFVSLTPKERQLLQVLVAGAWTYVDLAERCSCTKEAVRNHMKRMHRKTGCRNTVHMVALWLEEKHRAELSAAVQLIQGKVIGDRGARIVKTA